MAKDMTQRGIMWIYFSSKTKENASGVNPFVSLGSTPCRKKPGVHVKGNKMWLKTQKPSVNKSTTYLTFKPKHDLQRVLAMTTWHRQKETRTIYTRGSVKFNTGETNQTQDQQRDAGEINMQSQKGIETRTGRKTRDYQNKTGSCKTTKSLRPSSLQLFSSRYMNKKVRKRTKIACLSNNS